MEIIVVLLIVQSAVNALFAWRLITLARTVDFDRILDSEHLEGHITREEWNHRARELLRRIDNGHAQNDVRIAIAEVRLERKVDEMIEEIKKGSE